MASTLTGSQPFNFFLLGFIKSKVYKGNSATIEGLKGKIIATFQEHITEAIYRLIYINFVAACYNGAMEAFRKIIIIQK